MSKCFYITTAIDYVNGEPHLGHAYEKVIAACKKHRKFPGMGGVYEPQLMQKYVGMGMRFILSGNDLAFLMSGAKERSTMLRGIKL